MNIKRTLIRTVTLQDFCRDHFLSLEVVEKERMWGNYQFTAKFSTEVTERGSKDIPYGYGHTEDNAIENLVSLVSGREFDIAGFAVPVRVPVLAPYKGSK